MLSVSESKESQSSVHTPLDESKSNKAATKDYSLKTSGSKTLIYLFDEIFHFSLIRSLTIVSLCVEERSPTNPTLFAWCSDGANAISIIETDTKEEFSNFDRDQPRLWCFQTYHIWF